MSYGKWIELQCFVGRDWYFYHEKGTRLAEAIKASIAFMSKTPESRAKLARVKFSDMPPISVAKVTHREFIERLHQMIDVLCQIETVAGCTEKNGYYLTRRSNGEIFFIPPSENKNEQPAIFNYR